MADLSPELAARVEWLEAKYADNPGRYFVPLASEWRVGGDIARAEKILRENLKRFPGLSAHVLLGRCLSDRGAFQEAANEFRYVLSIDAQNPVALRALAEMAAAGGRRAEAEKWYNELLALDPMNVESRAALAQLARAPLDDPAPAQPAPSGADDGEFGMIDLGAPDASPADASGAAADDDGSEWGDLTLDSFPAAAQAQPAAADAGEFDAFGFGSVEISDDTSGTGSSADSTQWMDLEARQDVGEGAADDDAAADDDYGALPLLDDGLIDAPLAGADLPLLSAELPTDDDDRVSPVSQPGTGFGFGEPAGAFDDGPAPHDDGHDVDAEMVTETMAELYASQGLHAQAADVYRELIGQRGEEPGLVRRLAQIEAHMEPAAWADPSSPEGEPSAPAPDWLESVDAFASGGPAFAAEAGVQGGLSDLDLSPGLADAERLASTGLDAEPSAVADELGLIDSEYVSTDFAPASAGFAATEPESGGLDLAADIDELAVVEPAPVDGLAPAEVSAGADAGFAVGGFDAGESASPAEFAAASADPFADSFAGGFDGSAEPAGLAAGPAETAAADDGRQPWQAPVVADTEPVGFDILVMEDEDGEEIPASAEVVADVSADWAMAAAPLDEDDEDGDAADVEPAYTAPAQEPASAVSAASPGRTMAGYFASLLGWQPGLSAAPTYEGSADAGAITLEPAAPDAFDAAPSDAAPSYESELPPFPPEPSPFGGAPAIPTFDAPSFQPPPPSYGAEAPAPAADEPWAAAEQEPWASAPDAPAADAGSGDAGGLPLLDLDEPWAESPVPSAEPVDIGAFELADDTVPAEPAQSPAEAGAEELLPWEMPAEPAAAAPEEAPAAAGFSFEDFFAGAPAAPAAETPLAEPEPEIAAPPAEPAPSFIPSFAEPTPPPVFEAPAAALPASAGPAPEAEGEEDEDLESFQAWLQSLKR